MCDCNMTSYWDGIQCSPRLSANASCSYSYQCEANLICIVNETDLGVFSDVCRCPLGSYYVNGSGCVDSQNYTESCIGTYQCYEPAPLSCRYSDTSLTCLDTDTYPLPRCDCSDYYFFDLATNLCQPLSDRNSTCSDSCECMAPYRCVSGICDCYYFYSSLNQTCVDFLTFGDQCSSTAQCAATPNALLSCITGTCACNASGYWDGSQCQFTNNFRATCTTDSNCFSGLVCRSIACLGSTKRCSCPDKKVYSALYGNCTECDGGAGNKYERYAVNYPTSDKCIAARSPGGKASDSIAFTTADGQCNGLAPIGLSGTSRLLSVHNLTELNCIGDVLEANEKDRTCGKSRYHYLGYIPANMTFYDGTVYTAAFSSPTVSSGKCLTFCFNDDGSGTIVFQSCSDFSSSNRYGALCDYFIT